VTFLPGSQSTLATMSWTHGEAVDGNGNVFFTTENTNYSGGALYEILAVNGSIPASPTVNKLASFSNIPMGIAIDGSGNLFVADWNSADIYSSSNSVYEILAAGGYTTVNTLASVLSEPDSVAVDGSGNVYVADSHNNAVYEILAVGGYAKVNTLGSGFLYPNGVAVDSSGNVFVADGGHSAVKEILAVGGSIPATPVINTLASSFSFGFPESVALDVSENVYVGDDNTNKLYKIEAAGGYTTVETLGSGNYSFLSLDGGGNVFFIDSSSNSVEKLDYADPPALTFAAATAAGSTDTTDGTLTVTVKNIGSGSATLNLTGIAVASAQSGTNFIIDSAMTTCTTSSQLAAGTSCVVGVDFTPSAGTSGPLSGTLTLTDNALNASAAKQVIALSGTVAAAVEKITPTVTVTPVPAEIYASQALTVNVTVSGGSGNPTPTGTMGLAAGVCSTCSDTNLSNGSATFNIPAGSLAAGTDTIKVFYDPDSNSPTYNAASGLNTVSVTAGSPNYTAEFGSVAVGQTSTAILYPPADWQRHYLQCPCSYARHTQSGLCLRQRRHLRGHDLYLRRNLHGECYLHPEVHRNAQWRGCAI
jgi:sugar lactone lactonase YvrE